MKEDDLIPFDWDLYCAGDGKYYIYNNSRGYIEASSDLGRVENKDGGVSYINLFLCKIYLDTDLRLLKPKQEDYDHFKDAPDWAVCKAFDGLDSKWCWYDCSDIKYILEDEVWDCATVDIRYKYDQNAPLFEGDPKDSLIMRKK